MAHIDYFFATVSPFSYLAGDRLERIAGRHGATVTYRPFDILTLFARTGGTPPGERHPNRQSYRLQDLRRSAAAAGMKINVQPAYWPVNPAPSSYALISAQATGDGDPGALARALLSACWAEERDIADAETIADCLSAAGFDPLLAERGMLTAAERYAANLEEAVARGVFGAPTYVVGDERFWGHDRLDHLEMHLEGRI